MLETGPDFLKWSSHTARVSKCSANCADTKLIFGRFSVFFFNKTCRQRRSRNLQTNYQQITSRLPINPFAFIGYQFSKSTVECWSVLGLKIPCEHIVQFVTCHFMMDFEFIIIIYNYRSVRSLLYSINWVFHSCLFEFRSWNSSQEWIINSHYTIPDCRLVIEKSERSTVKPSLIVPKLLGK